MKKLIALILALVMIFALSVSAFAASNPTDISGHQYEKEIKRLDGYNAITGLMNGANFNPDQKISEAEFCKIITGLFPGRNVGTLSTSTGAATMSWACRQLETISNALGYQTSWQQVNYEELTRARACFLICLWLDSSSGIQDMIGANITVVTTRGFYGPDGYWYKAADGYSAAQSSISTRGFWHFNTGKWYYYYTYGTYNKDTQYGYWYNNKWYTYEGSMTDGYNGGHNGVYDPGFMVPDYGYNYWYCPFEDVYGTYYYDAVVWMTNNGYTQGTSATTFSPEQTCSQAEILTFIWRAYDSPNSTATCPISGVDKDAYYYKALCWAGEKGMFSGTGDNNDPTKTICTRAMAVHYLWKAAGSPYASYSSYSKFTDISSSASYKNAAGWAVENNITLGTTSTTFSPLNSVTRGQIAVFLFRARH